MSQGGQVTVLNDVEVQQRGALGTAAPTGRDGLELKERVRPHSTGTCCEGKRHPERIKICSEDISTLSNDPAVQTYERVT